MTKIIAALIAVARAVPALEGIVKTVLRWIEREQARKREIEAIERRQGKRARNIAAIQRVLDEHSVGQHPEVVAAPSVSSSSESSTGIRR